MVHIDNLYTPQEVLTQIAVGLLIQVEYTSVPITLEKLENASLRLQRVIRRLKRKPAKKAA